MLKALEWIDKLCDLAEKSSEAYERSCGTRAHMG